MKPITDISLIARPFMAFTFNPHRVDGDIDYVASVENLWVDPDNPEHRTLSIKIVATGSHFVLDGKGLIIDSPEARFNGMRPILQWQGFEFHHHRPGSYLDKMREHACADVAAGRAGLREDRLNLVPAKRERYIILQPALVISKFVAFTDDPSSTPDMSSYIARVTSQTPETLRLQVLNGSWPIDIDRDGCFDDYANVRPDLHRRSCFFLWQGDDRNSVRSDLKAGTTGPLTAPQLATDRRIGNLPFSEVAHRLAILGDERLKRFIASEFPILL